MGMFLGGVIGVLSFFAGIAMLVMGFTLLIVYPVHLLWFLPLSGYLMYRLWRWAFKPRKKVVPPEEYHRFYPPGYKVPFSDNPPPRPEHYVEPFTIGGHVRRGHSGNHHGQ